MPQGLINKILNFFEDESTNNPGHTFGDAQTRFGRFPVDFRPHLDNHGDAGVFRTRVPGSAFREFFNSPIEVSTKNMLEEPRSLSSLNNILFHEDMHGLLNDPEVLKFLMRQSPETFTSRFADGTTSNAIPRTREAQDHNLIHRILNDLSFTPNTPEDENALDRMFQLMSPRKEDNRVLELLSKIRERRPSIE